MGNLLLSLGLLRAGAAPEQVTDGRFVARRIRCGITYYYTPLSGERDPTSHLASGSAALCPASSPPPSPLPASDSPTPADSSSTPLLSGAQSQSGFASATRPLLLFFSWLGAQPGAVAKYRDLYLDRGIDVLVVRSNVMHFLWPRWGLDYGLEVLTVLEEPRFSGRTVLVHASSIGGYTFTQILCHIAEGQGKHSGLARRVIGLIFDSLVVGTLEHMAIGLGKTLAPRFEGVVRNAALLYFWLLKSHTADFYDRSIRVFLDSPVAAPALFFSSEDDVMCDQAVMEKCVDHWRRRGVSVESRKWKESTHAAHMRCHPAEYLSALEKFLSSLPLPTLALKKMN